MCKYCEYHEKEELIAINCEVTYKFSMDIIIHDNLQVEFIYPRKLQNYED